MSPEQNPSSPRLRTNISQTSSPAGFGEEHTRCCESNPFTHGVDAKAYTGCSSDFSPCSPSIPNNPVTMACPPKRRVTVSIAACKLAYAAADRAEQSASLRCELAHSQGTES